MDQEMFFALLIDPTTYVVFFIAILSFVIGRKTTKPITVCPTTQAEIMDKAMDEIQSLYASGISDSEFGEKCMEVRSSWRALLTRLHKK